MKCSKIQDKLLEYVYGELKPEDAVRVEQHLKDCPECAAALKDIEFTRKVFHRAEARVPSNHTVEKLCDAAAEAARLNEHPQEKRRRVIPLFSADVLRPFLAGAASVMILIGMASWIFKPGIYTRDVPSSREQSFVALNPNTERDLIRRASSEGRWNDPDRVVEELLQKSRRKESAFRASLNLVLPVLLKPDDPRAPRCALQAADILYRNDCPYEAFLLYSHLNHKYDGFERNYEVSRRLGDILAAYGTKKEAVKYYEQAIKQEPSLESDLRPLINGLQ